MSNTRFITATINGIEMEVPRLNTLWKGQGGLNAGLFPGQDGAPDYFLIAPMTVPRPPQPLTYGGYGKKTPGADSKSDGLANTLALFASENDHPIATYVRGLVIEGFADLYAPAIMELAQLRITVPQLFPADEDWGLSSSQSSANAAWNQDFDDGNEGVYSKNLAGFVLPVRRLTVQ